MSIFDRGLRGNIQSPFQSANDAASTAYTNPRLPSAFGGNVQLAIDYVLDALYPNYKGTVANPAALPVTATANDFYIVMDDGDGHSAGYVYSVLEGATQWIKRYDVDWSYEQILADTITRTSYMYAAKYGVTDKDAAGNAITGVYAGQRVYGGDQTAQNLTLTANSKDLTGAIQVDNSVLPTAFNTLDLGSAANKFKTGWFKTSVVVDTLNLTPGVITDNSGSLSFGATDLSTTGTLESGAATIDSTLLLTSGTIADSSGEITFGPTDLSTLGTVTAAAGSTLADITFTAGTLATASAVFNFSGKDVSGIGTLTSSKVATGEVDVANLVLSGHTLTTNAAGTALILQAGSGGNTTTVQVNSKASFNNDVEITGALIADGSAQVTGALTVGSALKLETASSHAQVESTSGDLRLMPATNVTVYGAMLPDADGTRDLGASATRFKNIYLSGNVGDGTNAVSSFTLTSLRAINTGVQVGQGIFWDGSKWAPASPDLEVDHTQILNLTTGDAGHTQFALLAGRSGGQTLHGGTAASENLVLDSTSSATKGFVQVSSVFAPLVDNTLDLGTASANFRNIYSKGIHYGLRFDQYAGSSAYPTNSGASIGRVIWDTSVNQLLVDNGTSWAKVGNQKFLSDTTWDGSTTTQTITVSGSISDARTALWQLCDNSNNFERVYTSITATQTAVTITVSPPLPAGSYRLIGFN